MKLLDFIEKISNGENQNSDYEWALKEHFFLPSLVLVMEECRKHIIVPLYMDIRLILLSIDNKSVCKHMVMHT